MTETSAFPSAMRTLSPDGPGVESSPKHAAGWLDGAAGRDGAWVPARGGVTTALPTEVFQAWETLLVFVASTFGRSAVGRDQSTSADVELTGPADTAPTTLLRDQMGAVPQAAVQPPARRARQ